MFLLFKNWSIYDLLLWLLTYFRFKTKP